MIARLALSTPQVPALLRGTPELGDSQGCQGETGGLAKVRQLHPTDFLEMTFNQDSNVL